MTRIIRRTITTTLIETLTLIWVHTYDDEHVAPNETDGDALARSYVVTRSISRVTASCHTTIFPACVAALVEEKTE